MYSVLIQNQKTIEYFNQVYPLFVESMGTRIGCCRWNEEGDTIDTAIPDILSLTDDKEEWRAIIVQIDQDKSPELETIHGNPYDFKINQKLDCNVKESKIPLIRLTQMLGGIPAPEIDFESKLIEEESKVARVVYKQRESPDDEERRRQHLLLEQKYDFNGKRPSEIILITMRLKRYENSKEETKRAWVNQLETNSSEFWRRNKYPSICRFLVFDYKQEGHVKRNAYLFEFWYTILLLALNDINPSSLQAYRLYNVGVQINRKQMRQELQGKIYDLLGTRLYLNKELDRQVEARLKRKRVVPEYQTNMSLEVAMPGYNDVSVDPGEFPLTPKTSTSDYLQWKDACEKAEEQVNDAYRNAERELDRSADNMRFLSDMPEDQIHDLDRFEVEDLEKDLQIKYYDILEEQQKMPNTKRKDSPEKEALEKEIKALMVPRINMSYALEIFGLIAVVIAIGCLPGIIPCLVNRTGSLWALFSFMLILIALAGVIEIIVLYIQRAKLIAKVKDYNEYLEKEVIKLRSNIDDYEYFINSIVSYTRGSNYLRTVRKNIFKMETSIGGIQTHLHLIERTLEEMENWNTAFYLDCELQIDDTATVYLDPEVPPHECPLYEFRSREDTLVPLNETGNYVVSPLDFVTLFKIEREELYDNANT